jgi:type IV pilus assembly protein PilW
MRSLCNPPRLRGFSLVELMVAMALSLVLLGGVLAIFASSKKTYETTDRLSRIQETGRYALDTIVRDLRGAGYLGCMQRATFNSTLNNANTLLWNFQFPVQGFDAQGGAWDPPLDTDVAVQATALTDAGDALVIRGPRTEFEPLRIVASMTDTTNDVTIEDTDPALIEDGDIVQASDCGGRAIFQVTANADGVLSHEITDPAPTNLAAIPGNSKVDLDYAFTAGTPDGKRGSGELVAMRSVVYFLRPSTADATVPALWRRVGGADGPEEVAEGVENMQFQFGEDLNGDNIVAAGDYRSAADVDRWDRVISVRVALLVRSLSAYGTDRDGGTYELLEKTVTAPNDRHLRQVFSTTVTMRNSAT